MRAIEEYKNLPVIFMTAKVMDEEIDHYTAMGVVGVIKKLFDPEALSEDILRIWEGARE